jgi:hypothetical protein
VQHQEIPLVQVAAQIQVHGLTLADQRRAIGGKLHDPALIDLECRAEDRFLVLVEAIQVLHRALVRKDRLPRGFGVQAFGGQRLPKRRIPHAERAR